MEGKVCKKCGEQRIILNEEGICVFCEHPVKHGTTIKSSIHHSKGVSVKSKTGYIDENKYLRV